MRVAFDEQIFLLQRQGGISRYTVHLISLFSRNPDFGVEPFLPARLVWNDCAGDELSELGVRNGPSFLAPYPLRARSMIRPRRRSAGVDLVHHTFYHPRFLRDFPGVPKVITIHDMIPEVLPDAVGARVHRAKRRYVDAAALILVVSESSREDLVQFYGQPSAPVFVTPEGVDDRFRAGGDRLKAFPSDYLLYVGNRTGYKDFATLLSAFTAIARSFPDLVLVAVGGGAFTAEEVSAISSRGLSKRVVQRSVTDQELPGAYANAMAFVMPSRYEGFGLPVLESMAAGAPTILADSSSLPEVGGRAARYFVPGDVESLGEVLAEVLGSSRTRAEMIRLGRSRAGLFTWAQTAALTAQAYESVFGR